MNRFTVCLSIFALCLTVATDNSWAATTVGGIASSTGGGGGQPAGIPGCCRSPLALCVGSEPTDGVVYGWVSCSMSLLGSLTLTADYVDLCERACAHPISCLADTTTISNFYVTYGSCPGPDAVQPPSPVKNPTGGDGGYIS